MFVYFQVTMADKMAAERACKEPNPIIDGRKANVNLAYLGAKPRQNGLASEFFYILSVCLSLSAYVNLDYLLYTLTL